MSFVSNNRSNSAYARARKVASLRSFFKYLTNKAKVLDKNPALELESPKIVKRLPRYLNVDESKNYCLLLTVSTAFATMPFLHCFKLWYSIVRIGGN